MAPFFASALWLPPFVGNKAYLPTLALLVLYAAYTTIRERRMPPIPLFLVAYLGVYVLATIHGGNLDLASVKQGYFARPLTALVVATIVTTARRRLNVLILVVLFALSQVPIAAVQVSENLIRYGRAAASTDAVDQVTGSLATAQEPHQGSVLTFVAMIGLSIIVSLWLWGRLNAVIAFVLCLTLAAIGAVAATRAAPLFVLVLGVALVGGALSLGKWRPPIPRVAAVGTASLAAAAAVFGLSIAFYSGLYSGISEKEQQGAVGARPNAGSNPVEPPVTSDAILVARKVPVADGKRPSVTVSWRGVTRPSVQDWIGLYHPGDKNAAYIDWIHNSSCSRTEGGKAKSFGSCSFVLSVGGTYEFRLFTDAATRLARSETVSVEQVPAADLLPGRIAQLKLAAQISVRDGLAIAVIGRGPGSSEPAKPYYRDTHSIPRPQRTGSTWFGKLLTETGWLGVAAFLALLAWLVLLGRRLCRSTEASEDRVLGIALIGVAALTGATAVYGTFPSLPGYAVLFWAMVGLAISAARDGRRRATAGIVTEGQHSVRPDGS